MTLDTPRMETASPWRGWCYLVWLSWQRLARARLMVLVSVGLLAFTLFLVYLNTRFDRWGMWYWRLPRGFGPTYREYLEFLESTQQLPSGAPANALSTAVVAAVRTALDASGFIVFSEWVVFSIFATFLLPLWSLSFATEALGQDREAGNLIWLLSRPLSRPAIFLGKFLAAMPWTMLLNLGGFGLLCWAAGRPGALAWELYWPAVFWGTLAFSALFHLLGVWVRRPAVIAILYCFFLETLAGNLPGYAKRASLSFYVRCMMFDASDRYGIGPERPSIFLPVSGSFAWATLAAITAGLLLAGIIVFSRKEYLDAG